MNKLEICMKLLTIIKKQYNRCIRHFYKKHKLEFVDFVNFDKFNYDDKNDKKLNRYSREQIEKVLVDYLRKNNIKFSGETHQNGSCHAPMFKDLTTKETFVLCCTLRCWGGYMALAHGGTYMDYYMDYYE